LDLLKELRRRDIVSVKEASMAKQFKKWLLVAVRMQGKRDGCWFKGGWEWVRRDAGV
jgi:hypothetical protein